jgi:hypothetical protein
VFEDASRRAGRPSRRRDLERKFFGRHGPAAVSGAASIDAAVDALGHVPLPPPIDRPDTPEDRERYQTIFATRPARSRRQPRVCTLTTRRSRDRRGAV